MNYTFFFKERNIFIYHIFSIYKSCENGPKQKLVISQKQTYFSDKDILDLKEVITWINKG